MDEQTRYEPLPRWGHVSVVIGNKLYLWGGRIEDFSEESKTEVSPSILLLHVALVILIYTCTCNAIEGTFLISISVF
jgi:hypothetical protein